MAESMFKTTITGLGRTDELLKAIPRLTFTFTRQELVRFSKRVRAKTIKERLRGRPGIWFPAQERRTTIAGRIKRKKKDRSRAGQKVRTIRKVQDQIVGKNVRSFVPGGTREIGDLVSISKISRFLVWHELGTSGRNAVPARLGFQKLWKGLVPDARIKISKAMNRAITVADARSRRKTRRARVI